MQGLNWSTDRSTSGIVGAVCPELRRQLGSDPSGNGRATLAVVVPGLPGGGADTVAVYSVELLPSDDQETELALRAWPRFDSNYGVHGGARRFFLGEDGSTHVSTGRQMPDATDPIAAECLPGGGVDCDLAQTEAAPGP